MASIKKIEKVIEAHDAAKGKSLVDKLIYIPKQLDELDVMLEKELGLVKKDEVQDDRRVG